jgi:Outer membrane protein beta-barrel domain
MKRQLLLLMTICTLTAQGQDTLKAKISGGFKKILIGFNISPDYCSRTLKNNDATGTSGLIIDVRDKRETGRMGITAGVNICFNFTKKTGLETGIQYSAKGYQTTKYDLVYGVPDPAAPVRAKFRYNYHYIDIPLKINIIKGNGKLRLIAAAGITTNILLSATQTSILEYSGGKTEKQKKQSVYDYNKINISPMISLGADYRINGKMYLRAEPTFRYGMLKNINTPVTEHLWSAGLNIGFYCSLK